MFRFEKVILMGSMSTAYKCAEIISKKGLNVHFIETLVSGDKVPAIYRDSPKITWHFCLNKEWKDLLINEKKKTLFISVLNRFILPKDVLSNNNLTRINLHSSILPQYKGRNCCGWTIFNQEVETGVTWHYLTQEVDAGKILWQEKIRIEENDNSLKLFRKLNLLGIKLFQNNITSLLKNDLKGSPQKEINPSYFYYSKDKPNNGFLDQDWDIKKIIAFLRAMNWGPLDEFGKPMIKIKDDIFEIRSYKINPAKTPYYKDLVIKKDNTEIFLNLIRK